MASAAGAPATGHTVDRRAKLYRIALGALAVVLIAAASVSSAVAVSNARQNYLRNCAGCHGKHSEGDGGVTARAHPGRIKSHRLADCAWMKMMSNATLFRAIKDGGPAVGMRSEMPAWGERLSNQEIDDLVSYIREFCDARGRSQELPPLPHTALTPP